MKIAVEMQELPPPTMEEMQRFTQEQGAQMLEFQKKAGPQMMKFMEYPSLGEAWSRAVMTMM